VFHLQEKYEGICKINCRKRRGDTPPVRKGESYALPLRALKGDPPMFISKIRREAAFPTTLERKEERILEDFLSVT